MMQNHDKPEQHDQKLSRLKVGQPSNHYHDPAAFLPTRANFSPANPFRFRAVSPQAIMMQL